MGDLRFPFSLGDRVYFGVGVRLLGAAWPGDSRPGATREPYGLVFVGALVFRRVGLPDRFPIGPVHSCTPLERHLALGSVWVPFAKRRFRLSGAGFPSRSPDSGDRNRSLWQR